MIHSICGLLVQSEIDLGIEPDTTTNARVDVTVRLDEVPSRLEGALFTSPAFDAKPSWLLLRSGPWGRYLVGEGTSIVADPSPQTSQAALRLSLLGPCVGAVLQQRGIPALHASLVRTSSGCIAFVGPSGRGKSTLGAAAARRGFWLVGDDVAAITIDGQGVLVLPAPGPLKLWPDAARALGEQGSVILDDYPKQEIRRPVVERLPLEAIYALEDAPTSRSITCTPLPGALAATTVAQNLYRPEWFAPMVVGSWPLIAAAEIARRVPVLRLQRPRDLLRLDEVVSEVVARHDAPTLPPAPA